MPDGTPCTVFVGKSTAFIADGLRQRVAGVCQAGVCVSDLVETSHLSEPREVMGDEANEIVYEDKQGRSRRRFVSANV